VTSSPPHRRLGHTDDAPAPAGPYSQATRVGAVVQSAGQVGRLPDGTLLEGVGPQTQQALRNVLAALASCGAHETDIISMRVYLTDPDQFDAMNEAYTQVLSAPYPSRTTVYVGLRGGALVEIDALAVLA
jgi:2-iminobutanoate/2-iminopropanoate deaminase